MMALNAELTNGSECLTVNDDSKRQIEKRPALNAELKRTTLNVELWRDSDFECQTRDTALNAKLKTWL